MEEWREEEETRTSYHYESCKHFSKGKTHTRAGSNEREGGEKNKAHAELLIFFSLHSPPSLYLCGGSTFLKRGLSNSAEMRFAEWDKKKKKCWGGEGGGTCVLLSLSFYIWSVVAAQIKLDPGSWAFSTFFLISNYRRENLTDDLITIRVIFFISSWVMSED